MTTKKQDGVEKKSGGRKFAGLDAIAERPELPPEGCYVLELFVENIQRVKVARVKPEGDVVVITGKNGSGKTSMLRAIEWGLTGTSTVGTAPIRKGQRVGTVKMDIGDYWVTRTFTVLEGEAAEKEGREWATRLLVQAKDGGVHKKGQSVLNGLMGSISFDPLAFVRMDAPAQMKVLKGLVKLDVDLDAMDAVQKVDYDLRRDLGREVDSAKARLAGVAEPAEGLPAEPVNVEAITKRLEGAANHNSRVAAAQAEKNRCEEQAQKCGVEAQALREQANDLLTKASQLDGFPAFISIDEEPQVDNTAKHFLDRAAGIMVDEPVDTAAVTAELNAANALNAQIAEAARYRWIEKELREADERWTEVNQRMMTRAEERAAALERAGMPIDGLSLSDSEVMYKGIPLSQASSAEQIRVSMALGMASNPRLRVLRIQDGSLLDAESMALITEAAKTNGFQVWIERVQNGDAAGVVMEDGEASGDDVEVVK